MQAAALATPAARAVAVGGRAPFKGAAVQQARPALPRRRAARALSTAVSARATKTQQAYICVDCGYIYDGSEGPFEKLPSGYRCPVCSAPKRRFKPYSGPAGRNDAKSMNARYEAMQGSRGGGGGGEVNSSAFLVAGLAAAAGLVGLYLFLNSQYN